jgi:hypothetical protein
MYIYLNYNFMILLRKIPQWQSKIVKAAASLRCLPQIRSAGGCWFRMPSLLARACCALRILLLRVPHFTGALLVRGGHPTGVDEF